MRKVYPDYASRSYPSGRMMADGALSGAIRFTHTDMDWGRVLGTEGVSRPYFFSLLLCSSHPHCANIYAHTEAEEKDIGLDICHLLSLSPDMCFLSIIHLPSFVAEPTRRPRHPPPLQQTLSVDRVARWTIAARAVRSRTQVERRPRGR